MHHKTGHQTQMTSAVYFFPRRRLPTQQFAELDKLKLWPQLQRICGVYHQDAGCGSIQTDFVSLATVVKIENMSLSHSIFDLIRR
jgi:hypothetical protein